MIKKRATVRATVVAQIRTWRSLDAPLAVKEIKSYFGLGTRYVVTRRHPNGNEEIVSRHRTREAAENSLAKLDRRA